MVTTTNFEENAFKLSLITVLKWIMFSIHMSTFTISIHGIFFSTSSSQSNLSASIYIPRRRRPDHLTKSPRERNAEIDRSSHNHTHGWIVVEKSDDPLGKWNPNRNVAFSRVIFTDRQSLLANPIKKTRCWRRVKLLHLLLFLRTIAVEVRNRSDSVWSHSDYLFLFGWVISKVKLHHHPAKCVQQHNNWNWPTNNTTPPLLVVHPFTTWTGFPWYPSQPSSSSAAASGDETPPNDRGGTWGKVNWKAIKIEIWRWKTPKRWRGLLLRSLH